MYVKISVIYSDGSKYLNNLLIFLSGGRVPFCQVETIKKAAFLVPFERDPKFTGRSSIIQDIDLRIKTQRRVALCGIGGIG